MMAKNQSSMGLNDGRLGVNSSAGETRHNVDHADIKPQWDEVQPLDDEEIRIIDDLGNDADDIQDLPGIAQRLCEEAQEAHATQAKFILKLKGLIEFLRSIADKRAPPWPTDRVSDEEWLASARSAFGQLNDLGDVVGSESPASPGGGLSKRAFSDPANGHGGDGHAEWGWKPSTATDFETLSRLLAASAASSLALLQRDQSAQSPGGQFKPSPR